MKAIVLINTDLADDDKVKKELVALGIFKFQANGCYQFIAEVEGEDGTALRDYVYTVIRGIDGVRSTMTMPVTSSWLSTFKQLGSGLASG